MDLARYAALFLSESREQLSGCGQALLTWERAPAAAEPVVSLFRAMHTFKGMAGAMGYTNLGELAHRTETVLDRLRSDPASGREWLDLLFRVVDGLERGVGEAVEGRDAALDFRPLMAELEQAGGPLAGGRPVAPGESPAAPAGAGSRQVRVAIAPEAPLRGARALLALRGAEALGQVGALRPPLPAFEQEDFDGRFAFRFVGPADDAALAAAIRAAGEVAEVAVGEPPSRPEEATGARGRQIRIDLRRLDAMMSHVGELVVAKGRLVELAEAGDSPEMKAVAQRIARVAGALQGEVVQARMTPVWQVFDRFPRVVRDLARQLGKRVRFEVEGEEIELDRALLDEMHEPLMHLLRNAVDHGIEPPARRIAAGKAAEGVVRLSAASDRTTVLIRVGDDGAGIDRAKVLGRARSEGLVPAESTALDDDQLLGVLARPGFSTAGVVTGVSGRGMGMDAVRSRVHSLGGSLELSSSAEGGSVFTLRLPMTLAIVRALLARVGEERYAIPLASVTETVEFLPDRAVSLEGREAYVLRDQLVPTVRLRERLEVTGPRPPGRLPAVIIEVGTRRAALLVDALVGQQEIVVEAFDPPAGTIPVFSGATILGDGVPALIMNPAALV